MSIRKEVFAYLEEHPDFVQQIDTYMEGGHRLVPEVIPDGPDRAATVAKYISQWEEIDPNQEESSAPEEEPDRGADLDLLNRDYYYNEAEDVYVFFVDHSPKNPILDGEHVRQMKRAYSDWEGDDSTINEICREFGISRRDFIAIKTELGFTHDSAPLTDEEMVSQPIDESLKDIARQRERELERRWQKEKWKETERQAKELRDLKRGKLEPLGEYVVENPPSREIPQVSVEEREYLPVFSPSDLHLGKLGVDGYDIDSATRLVRRTTENILSRMTRYGRPKKSVVVLGNDWFHIDNPQKTTTAGTEQDIEGLPRNLIGIGYDLAVDVIDRIRQFGPVDVYVVPSNHGEWSDYHTMHGLRLGYRNIDDVQIHCETSPRQYIRYGENLIGLEHGDGAKDTKLPMIMAKEQPEAWGKTRWRYWLTGHMHHLAEKDRGVIIMQAPSLSGDDRWHEKQGYVLADRGNVAYLFDRERGHTDRMLSMVDP